MSDMQEFIANVFGPIAVVIGSVSFGGLILLIVLFRLLRLFRKTL